MVEGAVKRAAKALRLLKVTIMSGVFSGVVPNSLGRVEFRAVGRQLEYFHVATVLGEPLVGFALFVIRGVVLNQEHPVPAPIKRGHQNLIQKRHIGFPLEIVWLVEVGELRRVQTHRAKYLLRVPFAPGGNARLAGHPRPSGVQGGSLAKRRLVLKDDYGTFVPGFFLRRGYV